MPLLRASSTSASAIGGGSPRQPRRTEYRDASDERQGTARSGLDHTAGTVSGAAGVAPGRKTAPARWHRLPPAQATPGATGRRAAAMTGRRAVWLDRRRRQPSPRHETPAARSRTAW